MHTTEPIRPGGTSASTRVAIGILVGVVTAAAAAGCGTRVGGSFSPATTPPVATPATPVPTSTTVDTAAAVAAITANWEKFFDHATTLADRETLLENGSNYAAALTVRSKDPLQAQASAAVTAVALTTAGQATVTYDVSLAGKVALPNASGTAVLQDGTWKVSAQSFCSLITLGATGPTPGCS